LAFKGQQPQLADNQADDSFSIDPQMKQ